MKKKFSNYPRDDKKSSNEMKIISYNKVLCNFRIMFRIRFRIMYF